VLRHARASCADVAPRPGLGHCVRQPVGAADHKLAGAADRASGQLHAAVCAWPAQ
jgi:hypothetical protein